MKESLTEQLNKMPQYFDTGATKSYAFRKAQLEKLKTSVLNYETQLHDALFADLGKRPEESWVTETGFFITEINSTLKHLKQWMEPESVPTNLVNMPSKSYVVREPLGVVLIIAPWNYPFQLLFTPLIGAIAAGNTVVLKASEYAGNSAKVMGDIIRDAFSPEYILFNADNGAEVIPEMMKNFRFNHVFYTGSTTVGKIVYQMAAEKLVPVTLELGGKSAAIVESDANIKVAARRIAVAKFANAGQMCVAPDYVLVHESVKEKLIEQLKKSIHHFYSNDPLNDYNYGKIINEKQFDRLSGYLSQGKIEHGGKVDRSKLYIEPTIITGVNHHSAIMQDEIFGPILPIIGFNERSEAFEIVKRNPDPLAFYVFTSSNKIEKEWIQEIPFGGGCINNAAWHLTNHHLPFGGRGNSGIGNYHGKNSFETFSHRKAIMKTPSWFDPAIKYPPFKGKLKIFKWVIR